MVFVDGTALLRRSVDELGVRFRPDKPPPEALSFAAAIVGSVLKDCPYFVVRRYWFASYSGNEEDEIEHANQLRRSGNFEPMLYRKRNRREKGVDTGLTMSMLVNAFNQNYDIALMFAGDEDYLSLVNEVKRYGPTVHGAFFDVGLSKRLKLAFDNFTIIESRDIRRWEQYRGQLAAVAKKA